MNAPGLLAAPPPNLPLSRLPRTNLLVYHSVSGEIKAVTSKTTWQKRRREILEGMQEIMGPLPGKAKKCPLDPRVEEEVDCGTYVRRKVTYGAEPGSRVPAYLLVPKAALTSHRKLPAVLALHPTDMQYGNRVLLEQLRGNYRAYGRDLAERGFVVIAPPYPIMANYEPDLKALGYTSGTMKAVWDNMRALDVLETLPFVRKSGFGAIGHSLGGHNAIYTAVFDERIRVVVSSCGFDSFVDYMNGNITGWTSSRYMPKLLEYKDRLDQVPFDFYELIGALAPRKVFVNAPLRDSNFKADSVDRVIAAACEVYKLHKVPQNLQVVHPDCEHDFPAEARQKAYDFLEHGLR